MGGLELFMTRLSVFMTRLLQREGAGNGRLNKSLGERVCSYRVVVMNSFFFL